MDQPTRVPCPFCQNAEGYVRRLTIGTNDQRTLTYTCESCKQSWQGEPHAGEWPADMRLKSNSPTKVSA
jgi:hypothetical protein